MALYIPDINLEKGIKVFNHLTTGKDLPRSLKNMSDEEKYMH